MKTLTEERSVLKNEEVWLENSFDLLCFSLYIKQKDGVYHKIVHSSFIPIVFKHILVYYI